MQAKKREIMAAHKAFRPVRTVVKYPEGSLQNPDTCYVPALWTDVAGTIARERERLAQLAALAKETAGMQPGLFDKVGAA